MATQLLIYQSAMPLSRTRHRDCSLENTRNYAFSTTVNSVPLMAVEFARAIGEYAIVFAGQKGEILPAVILGMRGNENLYVSADQAWGAKYVPAFIRRYPFVFSRHDDQLVLCVDEEFPGLNRDGRGQPLFDANGKSSAYLDQVLAFLNQYQAEFARTREFCGKLDELGLLEPMRAEVTIEEGRQISLSGFLAINREKLKELPLEKLSALLKTDELELIYLHLHSLRNFEGLRERLETVLNAPPSVAAVDSPSQAGSAPEAVGASDVTA